MRLLFSLATIVALVIPQSMQVHGQESIPAGRDYMLYLPLIHSYYIPPPPPIQVRRLQFDTGLVATASKADILAQGGRCGDPIAVAAAAGPAPNQICLAEYNGPAYKVMVDGEVGLLVFLYTEISGEGEYQAFFTAEESGDDSLPQVATVSGAIFDTVYDFVGETIETEEPDPDDLNYAALSTDKETLERLYAEKKALDRYFLDRDLNPEETDSVAVGLLQMRGSPFLNPVPTPIRGTLESLCGSHIRRPAFILPIRALMMGGDLYIQVALFEDASGGADTIQFNLSQCLTAADADWTSWASLRSIMPAQVKSAFDAKYQEALGELAVVDVAIARGDWSEPVYDNVDMYVGALAISVGAATAAMVFMGGAGGGERWLIWDGAFSFPLELSSSITATQVISP